MLDIAEIREKLGFSQKEFARRIGVSPLACARWEKGTVPRDQHVDAIIELANNHNVRIGNEKLPKEELEDLKTELKDMLFTTEMAVLTLNNIGIKLRKHLEN
jgi:transcriptional regulator with XRE-family HTH domain